jgi:hypothetical protein
MIISPCVGCDSLANDKPLEERIFRSLGHAVGKDASSTGSSLMVTILTVLSRLGVYYS